MTTIIQDRNDLWAALSAPLPEGTISWRQDGRPVNRDGRFIARFVAYVDANTVRERLDSVVPGEWDFTLEPLPPVAGLDDDANQGQFNFKGRLQILGVIREDVGTGKDYKQASTDTFKRAAVRFGIAHELYSYEQNWVQMDGDGKYAKPVEDPAAAYARRYGKGGQGAARPTSTARTSGPTTGPSGAGTPDTETSTPAPETTRSPSTTTKPATSTGPQLVDDRQKTTDEQSCPKCGGRMWDNRLTKRNPKAPDFKCRDRSCDGVIWPPKDEKPKAAAKKKNGDKQGFRAGPDIEGLDEAPPPIDDDDMPPF